MAAYVPPHRRRAAGAAAARETAPPPRRSGPSAAREIFTGGVVVVNLKRRPDRLEKFAASAARALGDVEWSRFEAVDGASPEVAGDDAFAERWDATRNADYDRHCAPGPRRATAGERGCALSHVELWRRAAALRDPAAWTLVCEDDCRFERGFDAELRKRWPLVPGDADVVYLGFSDRGARAYVDGSGESVFEPTYGFATHCYALRPSAAKRFLDALPVAGPLDVWLADRRWLDARVYCVVVPGRGWRGTGAWLATQDQKPGDADVEQSSKARPLVEDVDAAAAAAAVAASLEQLQVAEPTLYDVLESPMEADFDTLKRKYQQLCLRLHPDKNPSASPEAFCRLQLAWETLRDADKRHAYDRTLEAQKEVVIWLDLALEDLTPEDGAYCYDCRCGGVYEILDEELAKGVSIVPCDGCSCHVRIVR